MGATAREKEGRIYILANQGEDTDRQVQADPDVIVSFQKGVSYVVVHGTAEASSDRAKIADLWTAFDKAWWDGPQDPLHRPGYLRNSGPLIERDAFLHRVFQQRL